MEGSPVGYRVCRNDAHTIMMNPAENPGRRFIPPVLSLSNLSGNWEIKGTRNPELIDQVMNGLRHTMDFPPHHLTAAP